MKTASELHRAMFKTVADRDLDALRQLYHHDYIYMASDGIEHKGADHGVEVAETYVTAFPDMVINIQYQYQPSPDVSVIEMRVKGTHRGDLEGIAPTNKRIELASCNVIEVRDGKIVREREYFDSLALLQQLGVMPGS